FKTEKRLSQFWSLVGRGIERLPQKWHDLFYGDPTVTAVKLRAAALPNDSTPLRSCTRRPSSACGGKRHLEPVSSWVAGRCVHDADPASRRRLAQWSGSDHLRGSGC